MLRTVQEAIEATERVIAAAKELKRSLMKYLFTYGPVPINQAEQVELKGGMVGEAPAAWTSRLLKDLADVMVSTSSQKKLAEASETASNCTRVLYLKVSDLAHPMNGRSIQRAANEYKIPPSKATQLKLVPANATVFPKRGAAISTNRKRRTAVPSAMDPNLVAVVPRDVDPGFLFRWLERLDLRSLIDTATLPQLNKKDLEPLDVSEPEPEVQRRIARDVEVIDDYIANGATRLEALFKTLLYHLMTGQVRVKELHLEQGG